MGTRAIRSEQSNDDGLPDFDATFVAQLDELFRWRRDERHFRSEPLPDGLIDQLLGIADLAPSVGNCQPWRFVRVTSPERRAAVMDNFRRANAEALDALDDVHAANYARLKLEGLGQSPEHLAVFADTDPIQGLGLGRRTMPETVAYSAVAAIQTLWLAARARGVGVGWVSIFEVERLKADLEIPTDWLLVGYLCIGFPVKPHDTPELERVGWQSRTPLSERVYLR
ncbi:MAG: 5,6-dimethylbenzimidazole synthase [Pseudomonadota bacterium]